MRVVVTYQYFLKPTSVHHHHESYGSVVESLNSIELRNKGSRVRISLSQTLVLSSIFVSVLYFGFIMMYWFLDT